MKGYVMQEDRKAIYRDRAGRHWQKSEMFGPTSWICIESMTVYERFRNLSKERGPLIKYVVDLSVD